MVEKELIIKRKGLEGYYTLFIGATIVCMDNHETKTIFKETYDTSFFGRKVLRESRMIVEGREEYFIYDKLMGRML